MMACSIPIEDIETYKYQLEFILTFVIGLTSVCYCFGSARYSHGEYRAPLYTALSNHARHADWDKGVEHNLLYLSWKPTFETKFTWFKHFK